MRTEDIIHSRRYRLFLQKMYFEKGNSMMSIAKYIFVAPLANVITTGSYTEGIVSIVLYGVLAWIIGRVMYQRVKTKGENKISLTEIEAEIGNQFNKFQQEMREQIINNGNNLREKNKR